MKRKWTKYFSDPRSFAKNGVIFLLLLFVVIYSLVQILPSVTDRVRTQTALAVRVNDETPIIGTVFRDETVLTASRSGTLVPLVADGERVSVGQCIANVYHSGGTAVKQAELSRIERRIEVLENSMDDGSLFAADLERIDKDTADALDTLYADAAHGNLENMVATENTFLIGVHKHDSIVSDNTDLAGELASLRMRRDTIAGEISADSVPLIAASSGYYYSSTDGYEGVFLPELTEGLTVESYKALTADAKPIETANACGKLVGDYVWYYVCLTTKEAAAGCRVGSYCTVRFPMESDAAFKLELLANVRASDTDEALLVFRANTAPENFSFKRTQEAYIVREAYAGLAVPKNAIRIVDGRKGVYILDGDIVRFRYIEEVFEYDDYCIVDDSLPTLWLRDDGTPLSDDEVTELTASAATPEEEAQREELRKQYRKVYPLSLYDSVIVSGKNLFDGKILA